MKMKINYVRLKAELERKFGTISNFMSTECGFVITNNKNPSCVRLKCPRHTSKSNEKGENCTANDNKGVWRCFSCDEGGSYIEAFMFAQNMGLEEATETLARLVGMDVDETDILTDKDILRMYCVIAAERFRKAIDEGANHPIVEEALRFILGERCIPKAIVKKMGFGVADAGPGGPIFSIMKKRYQLTDEDFIRVGLLSRDKKGSLHARFAFRIICWTGSNIYGRRFKEGDHHHFYSSNANVLFNTKTICKDMDVVFVVESILDAATIQGYIDNLHYKWGVIASLGTSFSAEKLAGYLFSMSPVEIVLVPDCDQWRKEGKLHARGQKSAIMRAKVFQAAGLQTRIAVLPDDSDPNDMAGKNHWDSRRFEKCVNDALPPILYRIYCTSRIYDTGTPGGRKYFLDAVRREIDTDPGETPSELIRCIAMWGHYGEADVREALYGDIRKALARKALRGLVEKGILTKAQFGEAVNILE